MAGRNLLILGVDGGGTQSRARLCSNSGQLLAEAVSGPANLRLGIEASFSSVVEAARKCLERAAIGHSSLSRVVACLALALIAGLPQATRGRVIARGRHMTRVLRRG